MAIKLTLKTNSGIEVVDAYHRVSSVKILGKKTISFVLTSHKDANQVHFQESAFEAAYDLEGKNPIAQAYLFLKTLPAFTDATDC
jgi:hypothetical protein